MAKAESKVTTLDDQDPTSTADQSSAAVAAEIKGENFDDNLSGTTVNLTIHVSPEEGGRDAVYIGHNGYGYQIPRGKPWKVPKEVAQIVADAVVTTYQPGPNGTVIEQVNPRFAYSIS